MTDIRPPAEPRRHFGFWQATALNITSVVGAGVFLSIPLMVAALPGPYALWGWVAAGALVCLDGLIWAELAAAIPGSGGSYLYLLECYGRERWGRLAAFLFIWQFLISGPLEVSTALIAMAQFAQAASPRFAQFCEERTLRLVVSESANLAISFGPAQLLGLGMGAFILWLLHRRIESLGKITLVVWLGVLGALAWLLIEGFARFQWTIAFNTDGIAERWPQSFAAGLTGAMIPAIYSYLGYYNVCYMADEVKDPGRTLPKAILASAGIVCAAFFLVHLALVGTIRWQDMPTAPPALDVYNLPIHFLREVRGPWAGSVFAALLVLSCFGSAFAALLSYSRIPYGAARHGHFFAMFRRMHPVWAIPHISLWLVGGLTLFWSFFELQSVITAMIVTRILEQFLGQSIGVMVLRRTQPDRPRPFRIWLYPLPCLLAIGGWSFVYCSTEGLYIAIGLVTLAVGATAFFAWAFWERTWPFGLNAPHESWPEGD